MSSADFRLWRVETIGTSMVLVHEIDPGKTYRAINRLGLGSSRQGDSFGPDLVGDNRTSQLSDRSEQG